MDAGRRSPWDAFVLHHAVTPTYANESDAKIRERFDNFGKAIYKANGVTPTTHINPSTGKITHTQAHLALHPYTKDGNKYGYRIVELLKDAQKKITWHAGNWDMNTRSIGMEVCIDARNAKLPEKALMLIADWLRPQDKKLGGKLSVYGHGQVSQLGTACPAKLLAQLPTLIDMINNPAKWNKKLWPSKPAPKPAPAPAPKPTPKPTPAPAPKPTAPAIPNIKAVFDPVHKYQLLRDTKLWDLSFKSWDKARAISTIKAGSIIDVAAISHHPLGGKYLISAYSYGKHINSGINLVDAKPYTPTPLKASQTPAAPSRDDQQDAKIGALEASVVGLMKLIGSAVSGLFGKK